MAVGRDTLFGIVTLIVWSGLIVIDRCLALGEVEKRTGPREGMWRVVGLTFHLCLGMGVVYRDWWDCSRDCGDELEVGRLADHFSDHQGE